jgi:hypothetical protein
MEALEMLDNWNSSISRDIENLSYKQKRDIDNLQLATEKRLTHIETQLTNIYDEIRTANLNKQVTNQKIENTLTQLDSFLNQH